MRRLALAFVLLLAAGCAGAPRRAPTAGIPPAQPPPAAAEPAPTARPTPGPVSAPWDTAGTAAARAARRNHAYPRGPNALGQKLVASLPDPASQAKGAETGEGDDGRPAAETAKPSPANDRACWEVQVLVTTSRDRAKQEAEHIQKLLNLSAWVVDDGAIHRVRAGGCLTADGASRLADRLRQQGYPEAFRTTRQP